MPLLFVMTSPFVKGVKTSSLVITSFFVLAYSCGIGEHRSILSGGCAACPENASGCDTYKLLYMKDYEYCLSCDSFTTATHTDEVIMRLCGKYEYLSHEGCEGCPETPKGCDTHKLYTKIFKRCMECVFMETTTPTPTVPSSWASSSPSSSASSSASSSPVNIWVILGACLACFIVLCLLIAKYIIPGAAKWYKGRARHQEPTTGSDESQAGQVLLPSNNSERAVQNHDHSTDNAESNLVLPDRNSAPTNADNLHLNTAEQVKALGGVN